MYIHTHTHTHTELREDLRNVMPCQVASSYWCFGWPYGCHLQCYAVQAEMETLCSETLVTTTEHSITSQKNVNFHQCHCENFRSFKCMVCEMTQKKSFTCSLNLLMISRTLILGLHYWNLYYNNRHEVSLYSYAFSVYDMKVICQLISNEQL